MSKWIRNRKRTNGCPDKLLGVSVEVKYRDGSTGLFDKAEDGGYCWDTSDNVSSDIMSYRIIEDTPSAKVKTPYEQLCEKYGVRPDVEWEVFSGLFNGMIVHISSDDDTSTPFFTSNNEDLEMSLMLGNIRPHKDPAKIAPKLWAAYKDVLNDEALSALRDVICEQWGSLMHSNRPAKDREHIIDAFCWKDTTHGTRFWGEVTDGKHNKPKSAIELQDAEIGISEPVNEVVHASIDDHIHHSANDIGVTGPVGPAVEFTIPLENGIGSWMCTECNEIVSTLVGHKCKPKYEYHKPCKGVLIDVYDVLVAFGVTCPAMAHAIKKMLMAGQRGAKDSVQDKEEAIASIKRSIELESEK